MEEHVNSIQPIDKATVHNICSGQVILNLASAVKELVENSLDAGTSSIEINVKEYGSESVEVIDNGHGVEERNFKGLTLKHHTSKLSDFGDLAHIETFGFRGEALSSLCALSEMTIITCHKDASVGARLEYNHDGVLIKQSPAARQVGTTVILKNLFCTLPVRHREFHSNLQKEFNKMLQVVTSFCLICTNTRFCCTNHTRKGKSTSLSTAGGSTVKENIACIFGSKQLSSLVEFHKKPLSSKVIEEYSLPSSLIQKADTFRMEGYISSCEHGQGRSSPDRQYFYVNNRPFDAVKVSRLVNEVYHTYNRHQYPFIFLNITTEKSTIDVNVTPDKRQIFMQNEKLLLAIIKCSLEESFEPQLAAVQCKKLEDFQTKYAISGHFVKKEVSDCSSVNSVLGKIKRSLESLRYEELSASKCQRLSLECENDKNKSDSTSPSKVIPSNGNSCQQVQSISTVLDKTSHEEKADDNEIINISTSNILNKIEKNKRTDKMLHLNEKRNKNFFQDCFSYRNKMSKKLLENSKNPLLNTLDMFSRKQNHMNSRRGKSVQSIESMEINSTCSEKLAEDTRKEQEQIEVENDSINVSQSTQSSVDTDTDVIEIADKASTRSRKIVVIEFSMDKLRASMMSKVTTMRKQEVFRKFKTKITPAENKNAEEELKKEISKDMFSRMQIIGQFNKGFIVTKHDTDLFIIDQHATDEKYNYEIMKENTIMETQKLLCPLDLNLTAVNKCVLLDNFEIFKKNGFDFIGVDNKDSDAKIQLISVPVSKKWNFGKEDVEEIIFMLTDCPGKMCRPSRMYQMFASRACRMSVMIGTVLSYNDMRKLVNHMGDIEQPWNCPHGRPTMRHLFNLALLDGS